MNRAPVPIMVVDLTAEAKGYPEITAKVSPTMFWTIVDGALWRSQDFHAEFGH